MEFNISLLCLEGLKLHAEMWPINILVLQHLITKAGKAWQSSFIISVYEVTFPRTFSRILIRTRNSLFLSWRTLDSRLVQVNFQILGF